MNQRFSYDRNYVENEVVIPDRNSPAVEQNRLQALKLLADLILSEVESLERDRDRKLVETDRIDLVQEVERFESDIIRCALVRTGGRQREAARLLNIKPTTLHAKLRRYGISHKLPGRASASLLEELSLTN